MTTSQENHIIDRCGKVDRTGLYIMVFIILMKSYPSKTEIRAEVEKALDARGMVVNEEKQ